MSRKLAIPLAHGQVKAALQLHQMCKGWKTTDETLDSLALAFPGFDLKSTLIKATAVNALYGTQVYALMKVAEHLCNILRNRTGPATPALVEKLAKVTFARGSKQTTWTFRSFASKFAHFFIDSNQFPIYDSYAVKMLPYHLNGKGRDGLSYEQFAEELWALKDALGFPVTTRELDRYLWLAGQLRAWRGLLPWARPYTGVNSELRRLFDSPAREVQELARAVLGTGENP